MTQFNTVLFSHVLLGVANTDSGVGIYAPDAESYTLFSELFYPIINVRFPRECLSFLVVLKGHC